MGGLCTDSYSPIHTLRSFGFSLLRTVVKLNLTCPGLLFLPLLMSLCVQQGAGLGRIKPNVLLMGFKRDWRCDSPQAAHHYIGILQ